jgi:hypothetical protein
VYCVCVQTEFVYTLLSWCVHTMYVCKLNSCARGVSLAGTFVLKKCRCSCEQNLFLNLLFLFPCLQEIIFVFPCGCSFRKKGTST